MTVTLRKHAGRELHGSFRPRIFPIMRSNRGGRVELVLSAWESERPDALARSTCGGRLPGVTSFRV